MSLAWLASYVASMISKLLAWNPSPQNTSNINYNIVVTYTYLFVKINKYTLKLLLGTGFPNKFYALVKNTLIISYEFLNAFYKMTNND